MSMIPDIADLLRVRAASDPDRTAIIEFDGGRLTYGQWWSQANAAAAMMRERGAESGTVVALAMSEDHLGDVAIAWVGTVLSGAVPMLATGLSRKSLFKGIEAVGVEFVIVDIERPVEHSSASTDFLLRMQRVASSNELEQDRMPSDTALVVHTSGTTGDPKWISCSNENLFWGKQVWKSRREVKLLCSLSVGDGLGILVDALCRGWSVVWHRDFNPAQFISLAARHSVRAASLYGSWVTTFSGSERPDAHETLEKLRTIFISGSPPTPDAVERLQSLAVNARIVNIYTQTETWPEGTMMVYDRSRPDAMGVPTTGTKIRVLGEDGSVLPPNSTGDIWLRPERPPRRYVGSSVNERKSITEDWICTGDRGYLDENGRLHLLDRWGSTIVRGIAEERIAEIDEVLSEYGPIREAAVFPVPDKRVGEEIAAAIVVEDSIDESLLIRFLMARLRPQQVPRIFHIVDALPRTTKGAVARHLLRQEVLRKLHAGGPADG